MDVYYLLSLFCLISRESDYPHKTPTVQERVKKQEVINTEAVGLFAKALMQGIILGNISFKSLRCFDKSPITALGGLVFVFVSLSLISNDKDYFVVVLDNLCRFNVNTDVRCKQQCYCKAG